MTPDLPLAAQTRTIPVMDLTQRQAAILFAVVHEHRRTGRPVGSRVLVDEGRIDASASTIRAELYRLEQLGLLDQPHTSAGRVPTDAGYRYYVDHMQTGRAVRRDERAAARQGEVAAGVDQIDTALRTTTAALAESTQLLALATTPPTRGTVVRHVEVLRVQPHVVVVVCITASGGVTKSVLTLAEPVDPGLVDWAGHYLNEEITGLELGQRMLDHKLQAPGLGAAERDFLMLLRPAFTKFVDELQPAVRVGGSSKLFAALGEHVQNIVRQVALLEERQQLLSELRRIVAVPHAPGTRARSQRVAIRIGSENSLDELAQLSVVGAQYGLPLRAIGIVGVIGPRSMDYGQALASVAAAADDLSRTVQELYGK